MKFLRFTRRVSVAAVVVCLVNLSPAFGQKASRADADRLAKKIDAIAQRGVIPSAKPLRTPITENEINSYLAVYGRDELPTGVMAPTVSILGDDRVSGRATIDLDAVRKNSSGGWFDPAAYLTGRVPVSAQGVLRTTNGVARFYLESAYVSGIPIPKGLLQQIVTYYTTGPDFPNGINLDDPFQLPAGIRRIEIGRAQAVVVQQ